MDTPQIPEKLLKFNKKTCNCKNDYLNKLQAERMHIFGMQIEFERNENECNGFKNNLQINEMDTFLMLVNQKLNGHAI